MGAVAKAWEDGPYLFIVKVQALFHGVELEDIAAEQLSFAFTSNERLFSYKGFYKSQSEKVRMLCKI